MRIPVLALLCLVFVLVACFPGNGRQRTVAGDYRLEQWEDGATFYLHKRGHDDSNEGGSIIGGSVLRIGWDSRFIVARRHSIYRGDPDGWMTIDVQTGKITGPFADAELQAHPEARGIATYPVSEAWKKL